MVKTRKMTPEEEAQFGIDPDELHEAVEDGEIEEGDMTELAQLLLGGKEVVISAQVKEFLEKEGLSEDEFIAMILKGGNRDQ